MVMPVRVRSALFIQRGVSPDQELEPLGTPETDAGRGTKPHGLPLGRSYTASPGVGRGESHSGKRAARGPEVWPSGSCGRSGRRKPQRGHSILRWAQEGGSMIIATGSAGIPRGALTKVRKRADDSFTSLIDIDPPPIDGWEADRTTGIALAMRCVEPHSDDWLGTGPEPPACDQASLFWLLQEPWHGRFYLQCGGDYATLGRGDWVLFSHSVPHCVTADSLWRGVAWQCRRI